MIVIVWVWTTRQQSSRIDTTWEFSAGPWTGWTTQRMLWCIFLSKVTLDKNSDNDIWMIILAVTTFRLIWHCLQFTTELVSGGTANQTKDRTLCAKTLSSHVIATNVFLLEWNHHWYCASTKEESNSYCGIQIGDAGQEYVYQCAGESWIGIRVILWDVLRYSYRKQLTNELSAKEMKMICRASKMGCPICKEPICIECWKEGYDKHEYFYSRNREAS